MIRITQLLCGVAICSIYLADVRASDTEESIGIPELIHRHQQRIVNGQFHCEISGSRGGATYGSIWDVAFDDGPAGGSSKRLFAKFVRNGTSGYLCNDCLAQGTVARFDSGIVRGMTSALSVYDRDANPALVYAPRLRWAGLLPFDMMNAGYVHPDSIWMSPKNLEVRDVEVDSLPCREASWIDNVGGKCRAVFGPQPHNNVLSIENISGDAPITDAIVTVWEHVGDLAFAKEVRYSREVAGKESATETVIFSDVSLNAGVPAEMFNVKRIPGLQPGGTTVNWASHVNPPGENGKLIWDGEKVAEREGIVHPKRQSPRILEGRNTWWLIGVNLLGIAAVILLLSVRLLRSPRSDKSGTGSASADTTNPHT